jgi:hypothetical protein
LHGEASPLSLASTLKHFGFVLGRECPVLGEFLQTGVFGQQERWGTPADGEERLMQGGGIEH